MADEPVPDIANASAGRNKFKKAYKYIVTRDAAFWTAWATVVMALTTAIYTHYARKQWSEMHSAGEQTDRIIRAANEINSALINANNQNSNAVKQTLGQNQGQFDMILDEMRKQSKAMRDAANTSQRGLTQASDNFAKDQRPYVWTSSIKPYPIEENKRLMVDVFFANYGKSPAIRECAVGRIFIGKDSLEKANDWFAFLGDAVPINQKQQQIIPPGIPTDPEKSPVRTTILSDNILKKDEIEFVVQNDFSAVVALRVEYFDGSGTRYWSDMCWFHFASGAIGMCGAHNQIH